MKCLEGPIQKYGCLKVIIKPKDNISVHKMLISQKRLILVECFYYSQPDILCKIVVLRPNQRQYCAFHISNQKVHSTSAY